MAARPNGVRGANFWDEIARRRHDGDVVFFMRSFGVRPSGGGLRILRQAYVRYYRALFALGRNNNIRKPNNIIPHSTHTENITT